MGHTPMGQMVEAHFSGQSGGGVGGQAHCTAHQDLPVTATSLETVPKLVGARRELEVPCSQSRQWKTSSPRQRTVGR